MENFNTSPSPDANKETEPKEFRIAHRSPTGIIGGGTEYVTKKMATSSLDYVRRGNPGWEVWVEDKNGNRFNFSDEENGSLEPYVLPEPPDMSVEEDLEALEASAREDLEMIKQLRGRPLHDEVVSTSTLQAMREAAVKYGVSLDVTAKPGELYFMDEQFIEAAKNGGTVPTPKTLGENQYHVSVFCRSAINLGNFWKEVNEKNYLV